MDDLKVNAFARQIWNYCNIQMPLIKSDAIVVLCSHDIRIAEFASKLFLEGWAPYLIFSGGISSFTSRIYSTSEAEVFREIAIANNIPPEAIIIETNSTNTQENLEFTWNIFEQRKLQPSKVILVQTPNMLRRAYATATHLFPDVEFFTTSHKISFEEAPHSYLSKEMLIHELVGDLQRISIYADRGFIKPQVIDPSVFNAYHELKNSGYKGNLIK